MFADKVECYLFIVNHNIFSIDTTIRGMLYLFMLKVKIKDLKDLFTSFVLLNVGFLSAGVQELPGNAGLFDMALALEWIKDYIIFFGGAPKKITIFGQGTGASSAILLSLSHISQGKLTTLNYS